MRVTSIQTHAIEPSQESLVSLLDRYVTQFAEQSVLAITSKIVSLCEGNVVSVGEIDKQDLIIRESDWYLPSEENKYGFTITLKNGILLPTAGIDESNTNGCYVLWPKNPQQTANEVRAYLCQRFKISLAGVIITDSKTTALRWGTSGIAIAHSGFEALNNYIGTEDIFGHRLRVTKSNVMDALAVSSVAVMGEGSERTPLAMIEEVPFVQFQDRDPTEEELAALQISLEDDLYAHQLYRGVEWRKGGSGSQN